jgi:hypothetical protein
MALGTQAVNCPQHTYLILKPYLHLVLVTKRITRKLPPSFTGVAL